MARQGQTEQDLDTLHTLHVKLLHVKLLNSLRPWSWRMLPNTGMLMSEHRVSPEGVEGVTEGSAGLGRDWPDFDSPPPQREPPEEKAAERSRQHPVLLASDSGTDGECPQVRPNPFLDLYKQVTGGGSFAKDQREDDRLKHCWTQVRVVEGKETQPGPHPLPHFIVWNGLLYCVTQRRGEEKTLLVVPRTKMETVLELAHSHPLAGYLGAANTTQRIRDRFHWPGMEAEVKPFGQSCSNCQKTSQRMPPPSPLIPLPIIEMPFERIGMVLVGPLPKSARGHEHILVIVDYATRYLEAVPLRKATAKSIAHELFLLCSWVGIPAEILTDQETPFMSQLMADLCTFQPNAQADAATCGI